MGIDFELIDGDFIGKEHYVCSVCKNLLENAVTLIHCQHSFCKSCIEGVDEATDDTAQCPICRTEFSVPDDVDDAFLIIRQVLSDLKLRCPFTNCTIVIGYDNFHSHKKACQFSEVKVICTFCNDSYKRRDQQLHRSSCVKYLNFEITRAI